MKCSINIWMSCNFKMYISYVDEHTISNKSWKMLISVDSIYEFLFHASFDTHMKELLFSARIRNMTSCVTFRYLNKTTCQFRRLSVSHRLPAVSILIGENISPGCNSCSALVYLTHSDTLGFQYRERNHRIWSYHIVRVISTTVWV